jgi:ribosomal protein S11
MVTIIETTNKTGKIKMWQVLFNGKPATKWKYARKYEAESAARHVSKIVNEKGLA